MSNYVRSRREGLRGKTLEKLLGHWVCMHRTRRKTWRRVPCMTWAAWSMENLPSKLDLLFSLREREWAWRCEARWGSGAKTRAGSQSLFDPQTPVFSFPLSIYLVHLDWIFWGTGCWAQNHPWFIHVSFLAAPLNMSPALCIVTSERIFCLLLPRTLGHYWSRQCCHVSQYGALHTSMRVLAMVGIQLISATIFEKAN